VTGLESDRFRMEQAIRELQAELQAAQARITELEQIIAWATPRKQYEIEPDLRKRLEEAEAARNETADYQPAQNAHAEGQEAV
jgi:seryl-tRNA synthetase